MIAAPARKGKGIEDVIARMAPQLPDTRKEVNSASSHFAELIEKFRPIATAQGTYSYPSICEFVDDILTPPEIDQFLQLTFPFNDSPCYKRNTGAFITALIKNSYDCGYNQFALRTQGIGGVDEIVRYFKATSEQPLQLHIT